MSRHPLHTAPPMTPASFLMPRRRLLVGLSVLFGLLAVGAAIDHGSVLLTWDEPMQRAVESSRSGWLDGTFRVMSRLGGTSVVLMAGLALAALTWRRCRSVSVAILVAMLSRPLLEAGLKEIVGRARPDFDRLVPGRGHSFPSGHVMAAVALWGLVPMIVPLFTRRRWLWWCSVGVSGVLVVGIAASRVYLGVHWFSDVVGGLVLGAFFLLGVEWLFDRMHHRGFEPCRRLAGDAVAVAEPAVAEPVTAEGSPASDLVGAGSGRR